MISLANFSIGNMILKWSNTSWNSAVDQTKGLSKLGRSLICTFLFFKSPCIYLKTFCIVAFHLTNKLNRKNRIAMVKNRIASNRKVKKSLQPYSTRGCAEPMLPMCQLKVKVTVKCQILNKQILDIMSCPLYKPYTNGRISLDVQSPCCPCVLH